MRYVIEIHDQSDSDMQEQACMAVFHMANNPPNRETLRGCGAVRAVEEAGKAFVGYDLVNVIARTIALLQ